MAAPKQPIPLPKISLTAIRRLAVGESCICSACDPTAVSAAFNREQGQFMQQAVFVVHARTGESQKMFVVTRIS